MNCRRLFRCFEGYVFLAVCVLWCEGIPQLYFTAEPSNATAAPGASVQLPCAASGLQPITIRWRQCADWIQNRSGLTEVQTSGSLLLHLTEPMLQSDLLDGPFRCCAYNAVGTLCTPPVFVELTDSLSKPQVDVLPQEPGVIINGSLRLLCQSQAPQSHPIQWLKDGGNLEETIRHTLLPNGVLQIAPVVHEDEGEYQCMTGNPPTPLTTSESVHISVLAARNGTTSGTPEDSPILAGPKKTVVNLQVERVVLECLAAGSWVDIKWSRNDGQPLPSGSQFIGHKNLELLSLATKDVGLSGYTCQANDTRSGLVTRESVTVEVTDYRLPQFTAVPRSGMFPYLVTGRLPCKATGNPMPDISWYLNGEPITSSVESRDQLVLWNLDENHEGIYQCVASNAVGSVHASAYLKVVVPDYPPEPPSNPLTETGDSRSIRITWHAPDHVHTFTVHYCKEPPYVTQPTSKGFCKSTARCCKGPGLIENHIFLPEQYSHSYLVTGLSPFSNYTLFLRSYNYTPSAASECVHGQTAEGVPITAPGFSLTGITANSILAMWDHVTDLTLTRGYLTAYRICYQETLLTDDAFICRQVNSSVTSFTIQGLKASTDYDVLMAMSTSTGYGPDSDIQSVQTTDVGNCSVPPIYPLDEANVLNDTKLGLAWSDLGADVPVIPVLGFKLSVSTVTSDEGIDLPASTRSYVISDLLPRSRYTITLRAYNGCGIGQAFVQTVTMPTITAEGSSFPPPDNITALALSATSVRLIWDPVQFSASCYYQVVYRTNTSLSEDNNLEAFRVDNYVVLEDLMPFTTYVLQVRVLQQSGSIGQYSPSIFCTTKEDVPSAPMNLSARPLDPHTISVSWSPPLNPNGIIQAYHIIYTQDAQEENRQEEPTWNTTRMNGTENSSTIKNLISNSTYFFLLRASTSAGVGNPSTVKVRTPKEPNYEVKVGPTGKGGQPTDAEKGIFIGIMLGSICILLCTMMAAIKYKRMKADHKQKMAARLPGGAHTRVPVSLLAHGGKSIEMEMTAISPMLALGAPQDQTPQANGQIACESPLLCPDHRPDNRDVPQDSSEEGVELPGTSVAGNRQEQQAQYRHTLPYMTDGQVSSLVKGYASPKCSASLPESGSEDGAEASNRWTPLRESTSGDSGMVGDMELSGEDTSPDFIEKVLREFGVVSNNISTRTGQV